MARAINRLTVQFVRNVKKPGRHADGGGLYLSTTNGGRRWIFLYRWQGKPIELGFGAARDVTLAKAREKARHAREQIALGINPKEARKISEGKTFGECADELIRNMRQSWENPKHAAQWVMTMREYAKPLRAMPVETVETADILAILKPIWTVKPETAARIRGRIERVLSFAAAQKLRSGENPARWRGHLDQVLPLRVRLSRGHHAALPYSEIGDFMKLLDQREAAAARALQFVILTAGRSGEVLGARWNEVDFERKVWTVPPERMKARREHRVPLSAAAIAVLEVQRAATFGEIVFEGLKREGSAPRQLSSMAMEMVLRRMKAGVTTHGFRSTFRDWASETTGFPHETCEMALAHTIANKAEAAYRRGDLFEKRRELMDAWAAYCTPTPRAPDEE